MSSGNSYYDDLRMKPEVIDLPENEDTLDIGEHVNDTSESASKPNVAISTNVRELLECPVCLNAMYPPISQVQIFYFTNYTRLGGLQLVMLMSYRSIFLFRPNLSQYIGNGR